MKSLFVLAASLLFSSETPENHRTSELTDSFQDFIQSITEENKELIVRFHRHLESFKIPFSHPQFTEIKTKLEKAQKVDQKIKVVAIIPSMTIKEIQG